MSEFEMRIRIRISKGSDFRVYCYSVLFVPTAGIGHLHSDPLVKLHVPCLQAKDLLAGKSTIEKGLGLTG